MRQGLCNGTLSVCLSQLSIAAVARGRFAAVGPAGWRYRAIAARPTPQQHGAQQHHDIQWRNDVVAAASSDGGAHWW